MVIYNKFRFFLLAIFLISLSALHLFSTTWLRLKLAHLSMRIQDDDSAVSVYKKIIRKEGLCSRYRTLSNDDLAHAHFMLANLLFKKNRSRESIHFFSKLKEINPAYKKDFPVHVFRDSSAYRKSALCLLRAGLTDLAIVQMQKYLGTNSDDALGYYALGLIYLKTGRDESAAEQFKKAIRLSHNVSDPKRYLSDIYLRLALISEKKEDFMKAIEYYWLAIDNKDNEYRAYHRLNQLCKRQGMKQECKDIENKILHLRPDYQVNYAFNKFLTLAGYSFNEYEFELFNEGEIVLFWDEPGRHNGDQMSRRSYEIRHLRNLAPNFGFESDFLGEDYPLGWDNDYYASSLPCHKIAMENAPYGKTQCVLLDNSLEKNTNLQSQHIPVEAGYYLQAGWIKSKGGNGFFGRRWYDQKRNPLIYNYAATSINSSEWEYYFQIIKVEPELGYCRLWLTNSESNGQVCFDNILFIRLDAPHSCLKS